MDEKEGRELLDVILEGPDSISVVLTKWASEGDDIAAVVLVGVLELNLPQQPLLAGALNLMFRQRHEDRQKSELREPSESDEEIIAYFENRHSCAYETRSDCSACKKKKEKK